MMTCRDVIEEFLSAYVAGDLSWAGRLRFRLHLAICRECWDYVRSYEETIRLGKAALRDAEMTATAEVPEKLVRAVLAARKRARG